MVGEVPASLSGGLVAIGVPGEGLLVAVGEVPMPISAAGVPLVDRLMPSEGGEGGEVPDGGLA